MGVSTRDNHPAIAIKNACLARSGVYYYTYDEMVARGHIPKVKKRLYAEYRPVDVLVRCKDKFAFTAVTKEHTPEETNPENFRMQVSGIVGENIVAEEMPDGNIGLFGNVALYTRDGHEYYAAGNKETSADYKSVVVPDISGQYDYLLRDIISVNGVVLTARGRGGPNVRVKDSANNIIGGGNMSGKKGVLSFLGIGRTKDEGFKLSKVVLDGAKTLHTLDAAGKEALVEKIMAHITELSDGDKKELLIGAVKDSLNHPIEAIAKTSEVSRVIDGLYDACLAEDEKLSAEALKGIVETKTADGKAAEEKKDDDDDDDDDEDGKKKKPPAKTTDSIDTMVDAIVEKTSKRVLDGIDALVDKKIKESLGIKDDGKQQKTKSGVSSTQDSGLDDATREDGSFLLDGTF